MQISLTKDPLRLILGAILVVLGVLALLGVNIGFLSTVFTVAGIIVGLLLVLRTKYL